MSYFALVSSQLEYCISLFRILSKFNLRKVQCIQNSAARIVSNTSRYPSITPVLKKLHWLPVEKCMVFKTATLFTSSTHRSSSVFCSISFFLHQFLQHQAQPKWWQFPFHSTVLLFINLSNSLVIALVSLCGMLFQMRLVPLHPWPLSEGSLKPTCTPKHTHLSLDYPLVFSVVLDPLLSLDTEIWYTALLVLLRLRVLLYGEIKPYKSTIRIGNFHYQLQLCFFLCSCLCLFY